MVEAAQGEAESEVECRLLLGDSSVSTASLRTRTREKGPRIAAVSSHPPA